MLKSNKNQDKKMKKNKNKNLNKISLMHTLPMYKNPRLKKLKKLKEE
jgi:hypothetical protein